MLRESAKHLCAWHTETPLRESRTCVLKLTSFLQNLPRARWECDSVASLCPFKLGECFDDTVCCSHWYQVSVLLEFECGFYTIISLRLIFLTDKKNHDDIHFLQHAHHVTCCLRTAESMMQHKIANLLNTEVSSFLLCFQTCVVTEQELCRWQSHAVMSRVGEAC